MGTLRKDLLEFVQQPKIPIDRDKCMVYGLKLMGRHSGNRHGLSGVTGTEYTREAFEAAVPLYEGASGYFGHPERKNAAAERAPLEKVFVYRNVRAKENGLYADAEYMSRHPHIELVLEAVEKRPHWFTLSHNAVGDGFVRDGKYVVNRILEVRSVDVVDRAATTKTLQESQEITMPTTIREQLAQFGVPMKKISLLEEGYPMLKPGVAEEAEEPQEVAKTWKEHLAAALTALLADETAGGGDERKNWIMQMIDMLNGHQPEANVVPPLAGSETPAPAGEIPPPDGDDDENGNGLDDTEEFAPDDEEEDPMKKITKESAEWKEFQQFQREKTVKALCESHKFEPTKQQIGILMDLRESRRPEAIAEFKAASRVKTGPRSTGRDTLESATVVPGKVEDFVRSITQ